jgi:hypothetical protein
MNLQHYKSATKELVEFNLEMWIIRNPIDWDAIIITHNTADMASINARIKAVMNSPINPILKIIAVVIVLIVLILLAHLEWMENIEHLELKPQLLIEKLNEK